MAEAKMPDDAEREVPEGAALFPLIPDELGVDPLLLAVIHTAVFLTGSESGIVDPEAADDAMGHVITYLQRLDGPQLQRVQEDLHTLVGYARQQKWPKQEVRFLSEFLKELGIGGPKQMK
jgi:hypothetical protein